MLVHHRLTGRLHVFFFAIEKKIRYDILRSSSRNQHINDDETFFILEKKSTTTTIADKKKSIHTIVPTWNKKKIHKFNSVLHTHRFHPLIIIYLSTTSKMCGFRIFRFSFFKIIINNDGKNIEIKRDKLNLMF